MMKIVLDTNVLLISMPLQSPYRPIFEGLLNGTFTLIISNEILSEYLEILERQTSFQVAHNFSRLLLSLPNISKQDIYYRFNLIKNAPDDNKFVDCAIAGNARYIVTEDKHFNSLKDEPLFKSEVIKADEFLKELIKI